ncbi:alpha-L-iduronidase [Carabus blaptoides fortunei]
MCESEYILSINASSTTIHLRHFWESSGFCPPAPRSNVSGYFLSKDVKMNMALIGSLPNRAIKQVRIHWLLDLVTIRSFEENTPIFNFTNLDLFLDWIHLHGLRPGFELMGNPSSYFNNFLNPKQQQDWQLLVKELAERYSIRYGRKYVSKWRFETWNEPDLRGYNILNLTFPGYLRYVQACYEGLRAAEYRTVEKSFKLGGPAGLFKSPNKHPLCWGLISECSKSQNCPLHFISFHKKGDGTASGVLNKGLELVNYIHTYFPRLKHLPIANDEADILTGWSKSQEWRADVRYAAMVVKVIIDHYEKFVRDMRVDIEVLSNDNAFLNYHPYYFTQRTLLARFQMNNTNPVHIQFFKKPVLVTMALLSYLGNRALNKPAQNEESLFSFLATATAAGALSSEKNVYEFAVILSFVNDTKEDKNFTKTFDISIINLPRAYVYKYVMYTLDNIRTNPYSAWKRHGAPVFPDADVRGKIRQVEGPHRLIAPSDLSPKTDLRLQFTATLPTVALLHICSDQGHPPGRVTKLQVYNVTYNEVLLIWKDHRLATKCIRTFEIEFQPDVIGNEIDNQLFKRLNSDDVIFLWYQYVTTGVPETTHGVYRARAVDYWGRTGPYSTPVRFPDEN